VSLPAIVLERASSFTFRFHLFLHPIPKSVASFCANYFLRQHQKRVLCARVVFACLFSVSASYFKLH